MQVRECIKRYLNVRDDNKILINLRGDKILLGQEKTAMQKSMQ